MIKKVVLGYRVPVNTLNRFRTCVRKIKANLPRNYTFEEALTEAMENYLISKDNENQKK